MKGAEFVAWGLIVLPMFIVVLSYVITYTHTNNPISSTKNNQLPPAPSVLKPNATGQTISSGQTINLPINKSPGNSLVTPSGSSCSVHT
jgi:hypothetical protein